MGDVQAIPSLGFARGEIVRREDDNAPNMLVVRGLGESTVVVVCERDEPGNLRLREVPTKELVKVLGTGGEQDREFNLRWDADMRAIRMWQAETGRDLVWPDHADLVVWLLRKMDEAGVKLPERAVI